jgi:hypothetical protein
MFRTVDLQRVGRNPLDCVYEPCGGAREAPPDGPIGWRGTASGAIDKSYSFDFLNPEAGRVR